MSGLGSLLCADVGFEPLPDKTGLSTTVGDPSLALGEMCFSKGRRRVLPMSSSLSPALLLPPGLRIGGDEANFMGFGASLAALLRRPTRSRASSACGGESVMRGRLPREQGPSPSPDSVCDGVIVRTPAEVPGRARSSWLGKRARAVESGGDELGRPGLRWDPSFSGKTPSWPRERGRRTRSACGAQYGEKSCHQTVHQCVRDGRRGKWGCGRWSREGGGGGGTTKEEEGTRVQGQGTRESTTWGKVRGHSLS